MPLYGLILAGGTSSRMGQDKGAMRYHRQPQTQYLAQLLEPYVEEVFVSVRAAQTGADHLEGLKTITDHYASPSPLNGIVSAMRFLPGASWLVIAVDMPNVTSSALAQLIAARDTSAVATCFASPAKGGPDPLLAIWEGSHFHVLDSLLSGTAGHVCPRQALKKLGARVLENSVSDAELMNINTPEEFKALRQDA